MLGPEYYREFAKWAGITDPRTIKEGFIYKPEKPPMPEDPGVAKAKLLADSSLGSDSSEVWDRAQKQIDGISEDVVTPKPSLNLDSAELKVGPRASLRIGAGLANKDLFNPKQDYNSPAWESLGKRLRSSDFASFKIADIEDKVVSENAVETGAKVGEVQTGQSILDSYQARLKDYNDSLKTPVQLDREYMDSLVAKMSQSDAVKRNQTLQGMNPAFRAFAIAFSVGRMIEGGDFYDGIEAFSAAMKADQDNIDLEYQTEQTRINSEKKNAEIQYQAAINMNKTDNEVVETFNKNLTNAFEADARFLQNQLTVFERSETNRLNREARLQIANQKNDTTKRGQSLRHLNVLGTLYQTLDGGLSPMVARMYNEIAKELGLEERWDETVNRPFTPKEKADLARADQLARKTFEMVESFDRRMAKLVSETGLNNKKAEFWAIRTQYYPEELQLKIDDHLRKINEGFYKNEFDYDKLNQNVAEADAKGKYDVFVKARDSALTEKNKAEAEFNDLFNKLKTTDPEEEGRTRTYEQFTEGEKAQLAYAQKKIADAKFALTTAESALQANPLDKLIQEAKAIYKQESESAREYKEMTKDGKKFVSTPGNINYQLNVPYGYGEESSKAADCSGLVCMAFNNAGLNIGRPTANSLASHPSFGSVYNTFRKTDVAKQQTNFKNIIAGLQPNDLILIDWEGTGKKFDHVVAFVGNNAIVHAPRTGTYSQKVEASKYLESMKGNPSIKVIRHKKLGGARVAT